jgi:NADPH-dependent glutamate synthase beta subunit-like oxidoreductase
MPKLSIDGREVEARKGATILDAAQKAGIHIPTMCFLKGCSASTSCMICVVKVDGLDKLLPACAAIAENGMRVESNSQEVCDARKAALELLLSDHVGDCMGPCHVACPASMNIPLMIRQIAAGRLRDAIATVKKDIALPAVLGRICPAPCERVCRRTAFDQPVSICLLKRYVADVDLESAEPYSPACKPTTDKRVAIVGAGPAGLAAAYYLSQEGCACTVFDDHDKPGGMLQYGVPADELPRDVLDREIALIEKLGVEFRANITIGTELTLGDLRKDFDAVFIAVGQLKPDDKGWLPLKTSETGIIVDGRTYQTSLPGVFAGGDAVRKRRLTVRAVADGKEAAAAICQYLCGRDVTGPTKPFNIRMGTLKDGEIETFMASAGKAPRTEPSAQGHGFADRQARDEAQRCLHCDCRKADNCKLRQYAHDYQAKARRYKGDLRLFEQYLQHADVIFEPGKCIDCGLCVQITARAGEALGLTFMGRGFDVRVAVPFEHSIAEGLKQTAHECVTACPTGALAFKNKTDQPH